MGKAYPKGQKDPIIRYFGCGWWLSRLIFGRVYDGQEDASWVEGFFGGFSGFAGA